MRQGMALTWALLGAVSCGLAAEEVDRSDPAAVGQAFVTRMAAQDLPAAFALATPDPMVERLVGAMSWAYGADGDRFGLLMAFLATSPTRPPFTVGAATVEGDEVLLPLTQQPTRQASLVLRADAAGHYAVDLRATMLRSLDNDPARRGLLTDLGNVEGYDLPPGAKLEDLAALRAAPQMGLVAVALQEYANERGHYPDAAIWMDEIVPYLRGGEDLFGDLVHPDEQYSVAFNVLLGGQPSPADWNAKEHTPLLASVAGNLPNAVFTPDEIATMQPRFGQFNAVIMVSRTTVYPAAGESVAQLDAIDGRHQGAERQLRALVQAARKYAEQHNGLLPDADHWTDQILPLVDTKGLPRGSAIASPYGPADACAYAINPALAGKAMSSLVNHRRLILFVEVEPGAPNRAVDPAEPGPSWHRSRTIPSTATLRYAGYLSGSARPMVEE